MEARLILQFYNPYAGEPLDWSARGERERRQREATMNAIMERLRAPRQKARHRYHPLDLRCLDCGVSMVANDNVPYGYGIDCAPAAGEKMK